MSKILKLFGLWILHLVVAGLLLPEIYTIPVKNAGPSNWNKESFWFYPWGKSVVHKGVDIFAPVGRAVVAPTYGLILKCGYNDMAGNYIVLIGPKWRVHYFAHLNSISVRKYQWVVSGEKIGSVGDTGNAKGKPSHLHYSIGTILPYTWRIDFSVQGWKKMFYLNPLDSME